MGIHSYGAMGVDWEERIRFDRLRDERLARIKALLADSSLGALLCFDMGNIRYITATHIGTWAADKLNRFCLLQQGGVEVVDGQQLMQSARVIKTRDEILLLNTACAMVDAAYDRLYEQLRPGFRENECVALVNKVLYEMGSEFVEGVNAISGERCNPHPHVFTDRALRPGDPAYFDILHSYMGYRTCYYRTFAISSASRSLVDA